MICLISFLLEESSISLNPFAVSILFPHFESERGESNPRLTDHNRTFYR
jgi:hypothetical protein